MAATHQIPQPGRLSAVTRVLQVLRFERKEIYAIYFYVILGGLVQLSLPLGIQSIISFVMGGALSTSLVILIALVILGVLVNGLLQVNTMKIIEKIQQQLFVRYAFQYACTLPRLRMEAMDGYYLPELINRFFDTLSLQKGISKILLDVPAATVQIFFGLLLLSFYHPVFVAFGALLLLVLWLLLRFTGSRGIATSLDESNYKYAVAGYLQEVARTLLAFKFAGRHSPHLNKTDELVTGYLAARTAHFRILQWQYWTLISLKVLVTAAMLIAGAYLLLDQQISVGQFIAAEIIILMIVGSVEKLIKSLDSVYDVLTAVEKVSKVLEKPIEPDGQHELQPGAKGLSLELKNVSFGYTADKAVLHDISLQLAAGEKVLLQGPHSSGKSTLLQLLSGLYHNYDGTFLVEENPLRHYRTDSYREQVGLRVFGQGIFEGTLWENISLGRPDVSAAYVNKLAAITGLSTFIEAHPEGLDQPMRPTGLHLPGRTTRIILLMRALAAKPALLLLEAPCDGMEPAAAGRVIRFLMEELTGSTVVIAGNNPEYRPLAGTVYTMEDGRLLPATN